MTKEIEISQRTDFNQTTTGVLHAHPAPQYRKELISIKPQPKGVYKDIKDKYRKELISIKPQHRACRVQHSFQYRKELISIKPQPSSRFFILVG